MSEPVQQVQARATARWYWKVGDRDGTTASDRAGRTKTRLRHFATPQLKFNYERERCQIECNRFKLEPQLGGNGNGSKYS